MINEDYFFVKPPRSIACLLNSDKREFKNKKKKNRSTCRKVKGKLPKHVSSFLFIGFFSKHDGTNLMASRRVDFN